MDKARVTQVIRAVISVDVDPETGQETDSQGGYVKIRVGQTRHRAQQAHRREVSPDDPEIELVSWAMEAMTELQSEGHVWLEGFRTGKSNPEASYRLEAEDRGYGSGITALEGGPQMAMAHALQHTNDKLMNGVAKLVEKLVDLSGAQVEAAQQWGEMKGEAGMVAALVEAQSQGAVLVSAIENLGPGLLAALSSGKGKKLDPKSEAELVEELGPRPASGKPRMVWDLRAIDTVAADLQQTWKQDPKALDDEIRGEIIRFHEQLGQLVTFLTMQSAAKSATESTE